MLRTGLMQELNVMYVAIQIGALFEQDCGTWFCVVDRQLDTVPLPLVTVGGSGGRVLVRLRVMSRRCGLVYLVSFSVWDSICLQPSFPSKGFIAVANWVGRRTHGVQRCHSGWWGVISCDGKGFYWRSRVLSCTTLCNSQYCGCEKIKRHVINNSRLRSIWAPCPILSPVSLAFQVFRGRLFTVWKRQLG